MRNILIVDDEEFIIEIWEEVLTEKGYSVKSAGNGNDAVALMELEQFDLVLTDMKMPGSDGVVLLEYLSEIAIKPKVIVSTGYVEFDDLLTRFEIDRIIHKPFDIRNELDELCLLLES